ncbi:MAG: ribosomal protein L15 [Parcubacteria bacterium C7867-007]|nr:MAG: ribosomal protein L15 [Parcubacteria bacterium C7867-007]
MQINTLAPKTPRITTARVGRGGTRGKTSGRGTKGQNARAGHKKRPEMRDLIKKIPKLRGHGKNRSRTVRPRISYVAVNLSALEANFAAGDAVHPIALTQKNLLGSRGGYLKQVKILGTGTLTKKLTVSGCEVSAAAKSAIEAAGGSISYGS